MHPRLDYRRRADRAGDPAAERRHMKLTANVRKVLVKQFLNGATIAELARTWPFAPPKIEAVMRERLRFHETNGAGLDAELPLNNTNRIERET
jgi:hypothetical protein